MKSLNKIAMIVALILPTLALSNWNLYIGDAQKSVITVSDEVALYDALAEDFFTAYAMKARLDNHKMVTVSSCILSDCFEDGTFALVPVEAIEETNEPETPYELTDDRSLTIGVMGYKAITLP